jgi:hypothetical protein
MILDTGLFTIGVPHYGVADDIYEGYFIPKGESTS